MPYRNRNLKLTVLIMLLHSCGYTKTPFQIVKFGNTDVEPMMIYWAIKCLISSLCGVQRGPLYTGIRQNELEDGEELLMFTIELSLFLPTFCLLSCLITYFILHSFLETAVFVFLPPLIPPFSAVYISSPLISYPPPLGRNASGPQAEMRTTLCITQLQLLLLLLLLFTILIQ